jgi:hypothetical protein
MDEQLDIILDWTPRLLAILHQLESDGFRVYQLRTGLWILEKP